MKKALIGSGGFANEVKWHMFMPKMTSFISDEYYTGQPLTLPLSKFDPEQYRVLIAIGDSKVRERIVNALPKETQFFSFIHPSAIILADDVELGDGSIICANCVLTTNIKIGAHSQLNLLTTVGHDCVIGDYFTTAPGAKVSGHCTFGRHVYLGTNSSVRQGISICDDVMVGLNAGVVKNIEEPGVYGKVPAVKLK